MISLPLSALIWHRCATYNPNHYPGEIPTPPFVSVPIGMIHETIQHPSDGPFKSKGEKTECTVVLTHEISNERQQKGNISQHAAIERLSDDDLMKIFSFDRLVSMALLPGHLWEWHRLVHVCRRWRYIIFDSPRSLDLQLFCTHGTPVKDNLDSWPALPIVMWYLTFSGPLPPLVSARDEDNIIAALQHPDRIRTIQLNVTTPLLERLATLARRPFPALEHLELSTQAKTGLILPTLKHILLSAENLVSLKLEALPSSGYISPEAFVVYLAVMTRLETLHLHFLPQISRPNSERNSPKKRAILSALEYFAFHGFSEYLERLLFGINAPVIKYIDITFFNQATTFDTPELLQFVCPPEARMSYDEAKVHCSETDISITLTPRETPHHIELYVRCMPLDWQLSCIAEICGSLALIISDVRDLHIDASSTLPSGQDDMDLLPLRDLLHQFRSVKRLFLTRKVAPYVKYALEQETATGVLPSAKVIEAKEYDSSPPYNPRRAPLSSSAIRLQPPLTMPLHPNHILPFKTPGTVPLHPYSAVPLYPPSSAPLHPQSQASTLPFRHPDRALIAHNIATYHMSRYEAARQKGDLDQAIVGYAEALLRGMDHPPMNILTFEHLTHALLTRFNDFGAREDLDHIISYFRHLSNLPLEVAGLKRLDVLNDFAIAVHCRFEVAGRLEDIEDLILLLRHVITMIPPGTDDYRIITCNLANTWYRKYEQTDGSEDLTEAISYYCAVLISCPLGHPLRPWYLSNLAWALMKRFEWSGDLNDVEDAATLYQESHDLLDKEHPDRMWVLMGLANVYHTRFGKTDDSEDLEKAISRYREVLLLCPPDHENKSTLLRNLANSLTSRFENFGRIDCLKEAILLHRAALRLCPRGHPHRQESLHGLANAMHLRCLRTHRIEDLEETINLQRETLALTPPGHRMRPRMLYCLSVSHQTQYTWTGDMGYIEEGIKHLYEASKLVKSGYPDSRRILHLLAVNLLYRFVHHGADKDIAGAIKHQRTSISFIPEGNPELSSMLSNFATGLATIFSRTGNAGYLEESIALSRSAVEYPFSSVRDRLIAAQNWTVTAHSTQHPSTLTAYRKALSLLQPAIDSSPTVQTRHEYITDRNIEPLWSLSMDAASYAIESHAYEEAVEMLEQGRVLLWSGMRSLRTPLEHLHEVDKSLADEFTEISQALEAIATTTDVRDFVQTPAGTDDDGVAIGRKDTFARDFAEKRRLSKELDKVVLRIQALPGFENFWRPVPFRHLQTAAIGGPVVIINLSGYRSDILIVRSNHPVVHIPTPTNFFCRVTTLAHQLSEARKTNLLESKKYDRVLRQTLEELSELVGQPVAKRLMELGIAEQSRIWLCPTSLLTSLPIHAAGPITSHTNVKRYLCDIYVCSYTPSLSALIASRSHTLSGSASGRPSLLIVADESLPGVDSEIRSVEGLVGSGSVTRIAGEAATPENVIAHLPMHPWVHFVCHVVLRPGRPFESSFLLQHNTYLTLLHIIKSHLPTAELAFLSACHTAGLAEDGMPDEALHMAAAMQFSGFRSVIGTLWATWDEDGRDLSEHFYSKMFAAGVQSANYEKSARALQHATRKLRREKRVSLERWVNFVHYGA